MRTPFPRRGRICRGRNLSLSDIEARPSVPEGEYLPSQESFAVGRERAEVAFQRSKIYRILSSSFLYPDEELLRFLKEDPLSGEVATIAGLYPPGIDPSDLMQEFGGVSFDLDSMVDEYVRFFSLKNGCPPYENEYYETNRYVYSTEPMADIAGFYRAFGMGIQGERPDHIGAELEFMHLAARKEAEAAWKGLREETELCASIQRKFLQDHLGRWMDAFSEALEEAGSVLYHAIARFLARWVDLECRYLSASPEKMTCPLFRPIEGSGEEPPACPGR